MQRRRLSQRHKPVKEHQCDSRQRQSPKEPKDDNFKITGMKHNPTGHGTGTKDAFVRKWLLETERENNAQESSLNIIKDRQKHSEIVQPEINFLSTHDTCYWDGNYHPTALRKRQRRNSSSDSSLLIAGITTMADPLIRDKIPNKYGEGEKAQQQLQMGNRAEMPHANTSDHAYNDQETFAKRPRRKTRQDLYNPKDQNRDSELHRQEKRPRTRGDKKIERKKVARKLGKDLTHNFSSESIAPGRLTFRPSQRLGLFNNARASSPQRTRGLPDLASSEMMFLQRPTRTPPSKAQEKTISKSREKDKGRAEREQLEISTFFKPGRAPLEEVVVNTRQPTSPTFMTEDMSIGKENTLDNCRPWRGPGEPFSNSPDRLDVMNGQPYRLSDTVCSASGGSYSAKPHTVASGHVGTYPWSETTYVSWSESERFPIVKVALERLKNIGGLDTSPIPESIRISIEKTGIFRGTGIESAIAFNQPHTSLDKRGEIEKPQAVSPGRGCPLMVNEGKAFSSNLPWSHGQTKQPLNRSQSPITPMPQGHDQKREDLGEGHSCGKRHPRVENYSVQSLQAIVEQLAPNSGRQSDKTTSSPLPIREAVCLKSPQNPTSPPMTREQIAELARVSRHSARVPVAEVAEEELLYGANESRAVQTNSQDNEEQASQPRVLGSKLPAQDPVSSYLDIGSDEAWPRSRAGDTIHRRCHAMESDKERSAMRGPEDTFATQPPTKPSSPKVVDYGRIITNTSISRNHGNRKQSSDATARSIFTLPVLESNDVWVQGTVSRPACLSPIAEYPEVDASQLPHLYLLETKGISNGGEYMGKRYDDRFKGERNILLPAEYNLCNQEHASTAVRSDNSKYDRLEGCVRGLPANYRGHSLNPELWEAQAEYLHQRLGDCELWADQESKRTGSHNLEGILFEGDSNPTYQDLRQGIRYKHVNDEVESVLPGFWRPYRTY